MTTRNLLLWVLLMIAKPIAAQQADIDSLKNELGKATNDSTRYAVCSEIYGYYEEVDKDSAVYYADKLITLAKQNKHPLAESVGLIWKGYQSTGKGKYDVAYQCFIRGITIAENNLGTSERWRTMKFAVGRPEKAGKIILAVAHQMFGLLMGFVQNYKQELWHLEEARRLAKENGDSSRVGTIEIAFGRRCIRNNQLDSALFFLNDAERLKIAAADMYMLPNVSSFKGSVFFKKGNYPEAGQYYLKGIKQAKESHNLTALTRNYFGISELYLKMNRTDSSLYYARESAKAIKALAAYQPALDPGTAYENLYLGFKQNNQPDSAFFYQGLALRTKDTLYNERINSLTEFQSLSFKEQLRLQELEKEKESYLTRVRTYALVSGLLVFIAIAIFLYRTNRLKQKANAILGATLSDLKSTQSQLIQSEKMASLGELTAGIAHEIQNPLNFVNNFSEVNTELIDELKTELKSGNTDEAILIANNIAANETKINQHGKRADAIIKGMLQHSQTNTGVKEPTDINNLADEYLRFAYHGLQAKDKSFSATLKTDFEESIGDINIIPQDIARVILNLINNAFYAVNEKKKAPQPPEGGVDYEPTVSVGTKKNGDKILITVKDNGNGIPQKILAKIFQPFFTTKPTGQGMGLGLSLSYDIVKAHGGEIKVNTVENGGSEFIIQLPIQTIS